MAEHANAALIRRFFSALKERDAATALSLIAADAVWRFPGTRGQIAGDHVGREGIVHFLHTVMTLTTGTFDLDIHDIAASDDHAVVLFTGHGERNGKTLHNPTALVVRIADGKASRFANSSGTSCPSTTFGRSAASISQR